MIIKRTLEEIYELADRNVGDVVIVKDSGGSYQVKLTSEGLRYITGGSADVWTLELICGEYELVPWEPKSGEPFYYVALEEPFVDRDVWCNEAAVLALLALGNVFHTRAEAEAHIPEIHEKYRKIREGKRFE